MDNANDITATFYDATSQYFKNQQVIDEEIELITSICKSTDKILDIGCGTGRHLIPLLDREYPIEGLDSSKKMLEILHKKNESAITYLADFFTHKSSRKYDLLLLFWNAFNEIALSNEQADLFFKKCSTLLSDNGKIIINIDDAETLDVANLSFCFQINNPEKLTYEWNVEYFDAKSNTTISSEVIKLSDKELKTQITQKWWREKEINTIAKANNFICKTKKINSNNELYLVITKNNGK